MTTRTGIVAITIGAVLTAGPALARTTKACTATAKALHYAKGIGVVLEVELEEAQVQGVVQLVDCNFDPRCQNLPTP